MGKGAEKIHQERLAGHVDLSDRDRLGVFHLERKKLRGKFIEVHKIMRSLIM